VALHRRLAIKLVAAGAGSLLARAFFGPASHLAATAPPPGQEWQAEAFLDSADQWANLPASYARWADQIALGRLEEVVQFLNRMGAQGWEAVSVQWIPKKDALYDLLSRRDYYEAPLKRRKQQG
jgi:hypothetical protein